MLTVPTSTLPQPQAAPSPGTSNLLMAAAEMGREGAFDRLKDVPPSTNIEDRRGDQLPSFMIRDPRHISRKGDRLPISTGGR